MSEWTWIDTLTRQFELCGASSGRDVVVVAETTTPAALTDTAGIALQRTGAASSTIVLPARVAGTAAVPPSIRHALQAAEMVIDCTAAGVGSLAETDVLVIGSRSPDGLERFPPHPGLEERARRGITMLDDGSSGVISSSTGTKLTIPLTDATVSGSWGCPRPGRRTDQWPSGFIAATLAADAKRPAAGQIVLMPGDVNISLHEVIHSPVTLKIEAGRISDIAGESGDADGIRAVLEGAGSDDAYRVAGVMLGLNHALAVSRAFDPQQPLDEKSQLSAGQVTVGFGVGVMDPADETPSRREPHNGSDPAAPADGPAPGLTLALGLRSATVQIGAITAVAAGRLASELQPDVYEIAATGH